MKVPQVSSRTAMVGPGVLAGEGGQRDALLDPSFLEGLRGRVFAWLEQHDLGLLDIAGTEAAGYRW
jgi:hypothetical protein